MFCKVLLAVVFAIAAFSKARSRAAFESFTQSLPRFGLPSRWVKASVGLAVIVAEAAVVALVFVVPRCGFVLAACMLVGFSAAIGVALKRGEQVACRCFGSSGPGVGPEHIVRNGILVGVAVVGALNGLAWPASSPESAVQILLAAIGAFLGILITRWDDLLFIARGLRSSHS